MAHEGKEVQAKRPRLVNPQESDGIVPEWYVFRGRHLTSRASVVRSSFEHVFGCSDLFVISNESDTDTHSYLEFVNVQYILICLQYNT